MRVLVYLETVKQSTQKNLPSLEEIDATVITLDDTETLIRAQKYGENHSEEDSEEDSEGKVQVIISGYKEENFGSQPPTPPSSSQTSQPSSPVQLSKTNFFNKFRVKTEDKNGQWTENQYVSQFPIDFIFRGSDSEG